MGGVLALRLAQARTRPLRALIVTGCFFPPARNRRALTTAVADYAAHRLAFARDAIGGRGDRTPSDGSARALGSLMRQIATPRSSEAMLSSVAEPVLVVHARDDHHVPVDYALAAARGRPGWTVRILERGGHHAHLHCRSRGWTRSRPGSPPRPSAMSLRIGDLQAGEVDADLRQHVLRLEAELLQQARVLLGIDLIGQLLLGLLDLVGLSVLADQIEDLVLGDLHGGPFVA
jgi:fermentation-respiration switch protein FrsA (DUF1100 family)